MFFMVITGTFWLVTRMVFLIHMSELTCSLTSPVVAADGLMSRKTLWNLFGMTRKIELFISVVETFRSEEQRPVACHFHMRVSFLLVVSSSSNDQHFIWHVCFRFDWFVPEDQLKERTLDITVKNDVSFFSKSKTSMGQVLTQMVYHIQ